MNAVTAAARGWLGTPFHHQARVRGVGVDCIGLVIGTARDAGDLLGPYDFYSYGPSPNPQVLLKEVNDNLRRSGALREGSVLLFRIMREPQHFGIYLGPSTNTFVHAYSVRGKVVEDVLDEVWRRRLLGIYEFKELAHG